MFVLAWNFLTFWKEKALNTFSEKNPKQPKLRSATKEKGGNKKILIVLGNGSQWELKIFMHLKWPKGSKIAV